MSHGCKNLRLDTKNLRLDTSQRPFLPKFAVKKNASLLTLGQRCKHHGSRLTAALQLKIVSNMNINILAATAALSFADILAWCFPLVVIVASAIGFGFAAYYWGRNARIENYLRRRKHDATATVKD